MKRSSVSVIISTRNRAALLRKVLDALRQQNPAGDIPFQVVVVDNGSNDSTAEVVSQYASMINMVYVREERLGLSYARNTGTGVASGDIVIFLDDDAIPSERYVEQMVEPFARDEVVCVGGRLVAQWPDGRPPGWYHEKFAHVVGQTSFGNRSGYLAPDTFPFGGSIAFRKAEFLRYGGFNVNLGRKGESFITGEEIDLCYRMQKDEHRFYYSHYAKAFHLVGETRATKGYFISSLRGKGTTECHQKRFNKGIHLFLIHFLIKLIYIIYHSFLLIIAGQNHEKAFFSQCRLSYCLGYFSYLTCQVNDDGHKDLA